MTTPDKDDPSVPRDSRFDAQWRAASREAPPPSLDATILAAARREVGAGPQRLDARTPSSAKRWMPLAIAATLGAVTFGVLQLVSTDRLVSPIADTAVVTDMPPPAVSASKDASVSDAKRAGEAAAPLAKPAGEAAAPLLKPAGEAAAPVPAPTPQQAPPPLSRPPLPPAPQPGVAAPPPASSQTDAMAGRPPPPNEEPHRRPLPTAEPAPEKRESARDDRAPALPQPFPSSPALSPAPQSSSPAPSPAPPPPPLQAAPEAPRPSPDAGIPLPSGRAAPAAAAPAPQSFAPTPRTQESAAMRASAAPKTVGRLAEGDAIAALAKERATLPVADWIALIRRLRAEGNAAEAAKELAAFRTAHADHERLLPADLRDWHPPAQ